MFEKARAVLFDLDGTIYYGSHIIEGANEAIEKCRELGKQVLFLSNNSAKTRAQLFERLEGMGVSCEPDEVFSSGYACALFAKREGLEEIYVSGTESLREEFARMGIESADSDHARNLVIGYDPGFTYEKLTEAVRVALRAEKIIACNKEKVYRGEGAQWFPGCGGMVAPIEWCASREVDYLVGKPNTFMPELVARELGLARDEVLVVGDTYGTDIRMANDFGCASVLIGDERHDDTTVIRRIGELVKLLG